MLHDLAGVHHGDALRHFTDHAHVVGDQHQGHTAVFLQAAQQVQNLRLYGYIQSRGGFIRNQQLGIAGNCHGNHDALAHAARELVRVDAQTALWRWNAHLFQQFDRPLAGCRLVHVQVQLQRFSQLEAHREAGVQAGSGVLKNHGQIFARQAPTLALGQGQQVMPVKAQFVGGYAPRVGHQAHQGHHGDAFSRAGFTHNAQHVTGIEREADAIDRIHGCVV